MQTHNVKWQVSLSNGETFFEGKSQFADVDGELSPWQKLMKYIDANSLSITSLSLFSGNRNYNIPPMGENPKFNPVIGGQVSQKPFDFNMFRYAEGDIDSSGSVTPDKLYTVAEAFFNGFKVQLWVDENNVDNCWVRIV